MQHVLSRSRARHLEMVQQARRNHCAAREKISSHPVIFTLVLQKRQLSSHLKFALMLVYIRPLIPLSISSRTKGKPALMHYQTILQARQGLLAAI